MVQLKDAGPAEMQSASQINTQRTGGQSVTEGRSTLPPVQPWASTESAGLDSTFCHEAQQAGSQAGRRPLN